MPNKIYQLIAAISFLTLSMILPDFCLAANVRFLSLADIHFDPFIACHADNSSPCPLIEKLQQAPVSKWADIFAANDSTHPEHRQDSNITLFKSSLTAAREAAEQEQARFVIILGDFLGHDFGRYYRKYARDKSSAGKHAFIEKTMQFVSLQIADAFRGIDVYPVVGNNDSYTGDYSSIVAGPFFQNTAQQWSRFIKTASNKADFNKQFPYAGYYAVTLPQQPHLRFIFLNSVLFSSKAKGKGVDIAAEKQLVWLEQELDTAHAKQQKVYIAMHIPPGIDVYSTLKTRLMTLIQFWKPQYVERYEAILQKHADDVYAIFSGHLHSDWFQILTFPNADAEIPVTGTPSISPLFGNNPGFKIYSFSSDSLHLIDFVTYYYSLDRDSKWGMEYDFNRIFQPSCQDCPAVRGMNLLQRTGQLADFFKLFYSTSTSSQPITTQWDPYYWCAIHHTTELTYKQCLGE